MQGNCIGFDVRRKLTFAESSSASSLFKKRRSSVEKDGTGTDSP